MRSSQNYTSTHSGEWGKKKGGPVSLSRTKTPDLPSEKENAYYSK
jgi:hypothetical protein